MARFQIYYDDETSVNLLGDVRPFGVACIVQKESGQQRKIIHGHDYYFWDGYRWMGCKVDGIIDRLLHRLPTDWLIMGRMIPDGKFQEIMAKAHKDCEGW